MLEIEQYHFIRPRSAFASTSKQATDLARQIGFPVVLKISSKDILHKTDVGGVAIGLRTGEEVKTAYKRMKDQVLHRAPKAHIDGVMVEEMISEGIEIIIGLVNDRQCGPAILFGLGGIYTELLNDISFRLLPITAEDARSMIHDLRAGALLRGYRGQKPVSEEMLVDLLLNASRLAQDLGEELDSVDLNPIVVWEDQHRVLDTRILLNQEKNPALVISPNIANLDVFFKAKAVALVGASSTPGKLGNSILDSLSQHDYKGKVYPINPGRKEIMGLSAYPNLDSVPDGTDLVVAVVSLTQVPDLITEIAARGIHNLVVVSGGGKELGETTRKLEASIREKAIQNQVRVVGPNCIGVFDGATRLDTFFQVHERMLRPKPGKVAMITQSGTVGVVFLEAASFGMSKFVSYGNRVDVDEADLLAYLDQDPETSIIACYVEGFEHGRKFMETARRVSQHKPVIIYKAGRSQVGAKASMSHTGFFGGSFPLYRGAFFQAGLIDVNSIDDLIAAAKALAMQPEAAGPRIAMISNGAGTLIQAMDLLDEYGLWMPALQPASVAQLKAVYPDFYIVQNPIDVTGSASSEDYILGIKSLLEDPNVDIIMPWFVFQDTPLDEGIVESLAHLSGTKPILCGGIGGPYTEKMGKALEAAGIPCFHSVRPWLAAARAVSFRSTIKKEKSNGNTMENRPVFCQPLELSRGGQERILSSKDHKNS
jgi:3-hydroxypropionyl-CoA synthetase (ADP-forming)